MRWIIWPGTPASFTRRWVKDWPCSFCWLFTPGGRGRLAAVSGLFLVGYGCFRFVAEFFREPDEHIGFVSGDWLTMGMVLSLPMVLAGIVIMVLAYNGRGK